jgi:hypothetical protein
MALAYSCSGSPPITATRSGKLPDCFASSLELVFRARSLVLFKPATPAIEPSMAVFKKFLLSIIIIITDYV